MRKTITVSLLKNYFEKKQSQLQEMNYSNIVPFYSHEPNIRLSEKPELQQFYK